MIGPGSLPLPVLVTLSMNVKSSPGLITCPGARSLFSVRSTSSISPASTVRFRSPAANV